MRAYSFEVSGAFRASDILQNVTCSMWARYRWAISCNNMYMFCAFLISKPSWFQGASDILICYHYIDLVKYLSNSQSSWMVGIVKWKFVPFLDTMFAVVLFISCDRDTCNRVLGVAEVSAPVFLHHFCEWPQWPALWRMPWWRHQLGENCQPISRMDTLEGNFSCKSTDLASTICIRAPGWCSSSGPTSIVLGFQGGTVCVDGLVERTRCDQSSGWFWVTGPMGDVFAPTVGRELTPLSSLPGTPRESWVSDRCLWPNIANIHKSMYIYANLMGTSHLQSTVVTLSYIVF